MGSIVGGVVGGFVALAILVGLFYYFYEGEKGIGAEAEEMVHARIGGRVNSDDKETQEKEAAATTIFLYYEGPEMHGGALKYPDADVPLGAPFEPSATPS